ncbi:hypothetical protein KZZ52_32940 [Dactylosporangium sp. AC04546]|uniref:hypothetical protein n=1 Tax=Dactylosporangium sp. AC04546 TaxID=2862460 RepID=UPI001EE1271D|nr:hypothetical protein [Dactylosporangium sp. AC04546]WVK78798.1 hypothetical protein KZZ52_32940 [Dactylosporangium sp. AC04546]
MDSEQDPHNPASTSPWLDEHYSLSADRTLALSEVAAAARIPTGDGVVWRAAVVATFGTDATGRTVTYLQYLQDVEWRVAERDILRILIRMLRSRIGI